MQENTSTRPQQRDNKYKSTWQKATVDLRTHDPGTQDTIRQFGVVVSSVAKYGIVPRDTQDSGETPLQAHSKFCGCSKAGLLVPCALSAQRREWCISTEENLDERTDSGRVDVEGKTGKKGKGL